MQPERHRANRWRDNQRGLRGVESEGCHTDRPRGHFAHRAAM